MKPHKATAKIQPLSVNVTVHVNATIAVDKVNTINTNVQRAHLTDAKLFIHILSIDATLVLVTPM